MVAQVKLSHLVFKTMPNYYSLKRLSFQLRQQQFTDVGQEWVRKMAMSHLSISCWMSIWGLIINLESKRSEFFLSVIVLELKYPRLRSFHQIYFPLVNKNRLLKRWVDTVRNWQLSRKKCFYRYHTKGFQATKFRNLLELIVELFRNFYNDTRKGKHRK